MLLFTPGISEGGVVGVKRGASWDVDQLMILVVPDMKLSPNVGSDRSWVWNAAADVSEGEPEPQTLAIRFANSESTCRLALPGNFGGHY